MTQAYVYTHCVMPLSRLSNRSRRTGLKRKGKAADKKTPSARHQRLWDAIRSTRDEIDKWQAKAEYVQTLFRQTILPREQRITNGVQQLTGSLIVLFEEPKRTQAERSLIGLWIIENLNSLSSHPFASKAQWETLSLDFSETLVSDDPIDIQLLRLLRAGATATEHALDASEARDDVSDISDEDLIFDFGWHKKETTSASTQHAEPTREDEIKKTDSDHDRLSKEEEPEPKEALDEKISSLEDKLSIDRLFRQLAKVLHPDREQDEARRAEKHQLMSQCLEARQNKDIDRLLELYCEHVGELPEGITDDSHEELITALELQLKQLQLELRQQRFGDALQTQIVERYADSDNSRTQHRIAQHAKELDRVIRENERTIKHLKTDEGFQRALEERRAIELDRMSIDEMTGYR